VGAPPPTPTEELRLARRIEQGDASARDELIERNLPLVRSMAAAYAGRGVPFEDLVQEGTVGLVCAVARFDHRRGPKLSTYAAWWIRRSLMDAVGGARTIRIPRSARRQMAAVHRAEEELRASAPAPASEQAVAGRSGLSVRTVRALSVVPHVSASLDEPVGDDATPLRELVAGGNSPAPDELAERRDGERRLWALIMSLPGRNREVLLRRYGLGEHRVQSHAEIGAHLGVGEERSRQLERQALQRLRELAAGRRRAA
jgi:RNA polymerase primary sigma factor